MPRNNSLVLSSGWYTVRMNASNPLAAAYYEITFQMQRGVGPVSIYTQIPLVMNTTIEMTVDPGWIGTDACYFIDFGNRESKGRRYVATGTWVLVLGRPTWLLVRGIHGLLYRCIFILIMTAHVLLHILL